MVLRPFFTPLCLRFSQQSANFLHIVYSLHFLTSANLRAADFHLKLLFCRYQQNSLFCCNVGTSVMVKETSKTFLQYDKSVFFTILIPFIAQIIVLILFAVCDSPSMTATQNRLITINAFFLLIVNLLIFGLNQYNQKKHLEFTEMQIQLQKEHDSAEYYKMLIAQNENQRILIHDMKKASSIHCTVK